MFMEPETLETDYYTVDSNHGETTYLPVDVEPGAVTNADLAQYLESEPDEPEAPVTRVHGWLWRLSASGYMDCTEWSPADSEADAIADIEQTHDIARCDVCDSWFDSAAVDYADTCEDCTLEQNEPADDDITTTDHEKFYQAGRLVLSYAANGVWYRHDIKSFPAGVMVSADIGDDYRAALRMLMQADQYFPSVWLISDHGNAHRIYID